MQPDKEILLLDEARMNQKIRRIAFEIFERNRKEKTILIAGIDGQGYTLAEKLAKILQEISPIKPETVKIKLDKNKVEKSEVELVPAVLNVKRTIIVVDDVLNSGKTIAHALLPFLNKEVKKIEVAVLVNRSHTTYPIQPSYTGYSIATTLADHIEVRLTKNKPGVYLH